MSEEKNELDDLPELPDDAVLQVREEIPDLPDDVEPIVRDAVPPLSRDVPAPAGPSPVDVSLSRSEPLLDLEPTLTPEPVAELEPFGELEPIAELEPLAEPEPVAEPEPIRAPVRPVEPVAAASPPRPGTPKLEPTPRPEPSPPVASRPASGDKPPLRVLDKAPIHLRLAAKIVVVGSVLPFMRAAEETVGQGWAVTFAAKLVILAAAWVWMRQVLHNWGPELPGLFGKLGSLHLKPASLEKKKKPSRAQKQTLQSLEHPFPTGLHLLSTVLIVAAVAIALRDPRSGPIGPIAPAEMLMLGWAAFTFVHIANYERWGRFSPLFPLMFLGMLFAGVASVFAGLGVDDGLMKIASILGGGIVAVGGGLAAYTIVEAMMQAKKEGDRKKKEALEARRAARKSRGTSSRA